MTLLDVRVPAPAPVVQDNLFTALVDDKAWQHLGVTGDEFRRQWYAGKYTDDPRLEVQALDHLMRTGVWRLTDSRRA